MSGFSRLATARAASRIVDGGENMYQNRRFEMEPQTDSRRTTLAISPSHLLCSSHLRRRKDRHTTLTQFTADGFNVKVLPLQEQKELMQLIIKQISVTRFDPDRDTESGRKGIFTTRIRTKWYKVNISLFASDLIPVGYKFRDQSSYFASNGGGGGS